MQDCSGSVFSHENDRVGVTNMMVVGYVTRIPIIGAELNSLLQAYTGIYSCIQQRNNGIKGIVWIRHVMRKQEVNDAVQEVVIKQSDMVQEIIIINNSTQPHTACMCPLHMRIAYSSNTTTPVRLLSVHCRLSGLYGELSSSCTRFISCSGDSWFQHSAAACEFAARKSGKTHAYT